MKSVTLECDALNPNAPTKSHKKKAQAGNKVENGEPVTLNGNGNDASPDASFDYVAMMNDPTSDFYNSQVAALNYFKPEVKQVTGDSWKTVKSKGSRKHSQGSDHDSIEHILQNGNVPKKASNKKKEVKEAKQEVAKVEHVPEVLQTVDPSQQIGSDPVKRLRNLRKKLKEIDALKTKDKASLEQEQLDKLSRYDEIQAQVDELAKLVEAL